MQDSVQASHWKRRMRSQNIEEDAPNTGRVQGDEGYIPPERRLLIARGRVLDGTRPKKRPWK